MKRVGYQLSATENYGAGETICTYREAGNHAQALLFCFEEFPMEQGYSGHHARKIGTVEVEESIPALSLDEPPALPID